MSKEWVMAQQVKSQALAVAQEEMSNSGIIKTCGNCEFSEKNGHMCLKYNSAPPIKVVSKGCPSWEQAVPF